MAQKPSILTQAEQSIETQSADSVSAGMVAQDGTVGAEGAVNMDIGKPGGWALGAWGRWLKDRGSAAAAFVTWKKK